MMSISPTRYGPMPEHSAGFLLPISAFMMKILRKLENWLQYTGGGVIEKIGKESYSQYDIVSITSPTPTHYNYLRDLLSENVPVIICEKPVVSTLDEVELIKSQYSSSTSKVLVNYIRTCFSQVEILDSPT